MAEKSIKRLCKLVEKVNCYSEFERRVLNFPKFYLDGLQRWTKKDLAEFYDRHKPVTA